MHPSNEQSIERSVERLRRRSFFVGFMREEAKFLFFGFAAAALASAAWVGISWWKTGSPSTPPLIAFGAGAAAIATIVAFLCAAVRRPRTIDVAKAWDDFSGAKDRMSSAIELHASEGAMATILREDAARAAAGVEPRRVYPVRMPRVGLWIPVPLAIFVLCAFLPGWLRAETPRNPHFEHTVGSQANAIKNYVAKEKGKELTKQRKEMLERLERLASDLTRDNMKKKDALAEIAKLMEQMKKDKNEEEAKKKELEKLLKSLQVNDKTKNLNEDMNNGNYDDAAKKVDEMIEKQNEEIKKKREAGAKPEDLKNLEDKVKDLEKIKAQLMKLKLSKYNINNMTEVLDFLEDFEGELGDLPDEEIVDGEP
jgi:predicted transcriptional regulator